MRAQLFSSSSPPTHQKPIQTGAEISPKNSIKEENSSTQETSSILQAENNPEREQLIPTIVEDASPRPLQLS